MKKKVKKSETAGRPSKYQVEYALQAKKLCMLDAGITDKHLADFFEVAISTINLWKREHPEFSESVKGGKLIADAKVAAMLFKRAIGFHYDEVTFEKIDLKVDGVADEDDIKTEAYKRKVVTKLVVPDVGAQMNWLKNRQREKWGQPEINFDSLTDEQLDKLIDLLTKRASNNEQGRED